MIAQAYFRIVAEKFLFRTQLCMGTLRNRVLEEEARPVKLDRDFSLQRVDEPLRLAQVRLGLPRVSVRSVSIPNTKILVLATDSATSAHADQLVLTLQQLPLRGLCTAGQSAQKW